MEQQEGGGPVLTLLLIRHGQCSSNLNHMVSGRTDSLLTDQGKQEAQLLASYFQKMKTPVDRIYSSPLLRAYHTALALAADRQQVVVDPRLIEKFYGVCEGIPEAEWFQMMKASGSDVWNYTPEGAETADSVHQRITEFFWSVVNEMLPVDPIAAPSTAEDDSSSSADGQQAAPRKTVALVTHGAVLFGFALFFMMELGALKLEDPASTPICNTGVNRLDFWRDAEGKIRGRTLYLNKLDHINGASLNVKRVAAGKMYTED